MATKAGVGFSHHRNVKKAVEEAVRTAMDQARSTSPKILMMFGGSGYDQQALVNNASAAVPGAILTGCSAEGVIGDDHREESHFCLATMAIDSDEIEFTPAFSEGLKANSEEVGRDIAQQLSAESKKNPVAALIFVDGLTLNFAALVRGLETSSSLSKIPLLGGTAGDFREVKATYQYTNKKAFQDGVSSILISGNTKLIHAATHGCVPVTKEHLITEVQGKRIIKIDGEPAFNIMKEYLGHPVWGPADSIGLCLAFKAEDSSNEPYCIRNILSIDDAGAAIIPTEVQPGPVWLAARDPEKINQGILDAVQGVHSQIENRVPKFALHFECAGRGSWMFPEQKADDIIRELRKAAPTTPRLGFYTFGEILGKSFYNYTSIFGVFC